MRLRDHWIRQNILTMEATCASFLSLTEFLNQPCSSFICFNWFFEQVLELAKKVTKTNDENEAKRRFKELINDPKMYYNDKDIPANESDANAHSVCSSVKDAERYCPRRTAAMKNWFDHTKQVTIIIRKGFYYLVSDLLFLFSIFGDLSSP